MIDGYVPVAGDEIVILNAAGGLSTNAQDVSLAFSGVSADFQFEVNFGAEAVTFVALNDAAPGTSNIFLGGDLDDTYQGGAGDDLIFGGGGEDVLFGNAGADTLTGGASADIFALGAGDGGAALSLADIITDFVDGVDLVGLTGGLGFAELTLADSGAGGTVVSITATAEILAVVDGITPSLLDETDFTVIA
jgi:Ca2+-binding RTX toxin-like protein